MGEIIFQVDDDNADDDDDGGEPVATRTPGTDSV